MTKLSKKTVDPDRLGHYINNLWSAFTLMDSKEDIRLLFKDLFTHTEYKMLAKRLEIARRLLDNERYEDIERELKVTANTIGRVSNLLQEKGDGLRKAHRKLGKLDESYRNQEKERQKNMENPFRRKTHRKTVLGQVVKAGVIALDRAVTKRVKQKTAQNILSQ